MGSNLKKELIVCLLAYNKAAQKKDLEEIIEILNDTKKPVLDDAELSHFLAVLLVEYFSKNPQLMKRKESEPLIAFCNRLKYTPESSPSSTRKKRI
jgi:hypothetical protein